MINNPKDIKDILKELDKITLKELDEAIKNVDKGERIMQSKEEIEKDIKLLKNISESFTYSMWSEDTEALRRILNYIDHLETEKQKVIEKLEEIIQSVEKCYNEMLSDVGGIKIINVSGLSRKEKEEVVNKRNCLLVQKHCYEEILEILKGKNNE